MCGIPFDKFGGNLEVFTKNLLPSVRHRKLNVRRDSFQIYEVDATIHLDP